MADDRRMAELEKSLLSDGGQMGRLLVGLVRGDDNLTTSARQPTVDPRAEAEKQRMKTEMLGLRQELAELKLRVEKQDEAARARELVISPPQTPVPTDREVEMGEEIQRLVHRLEAETAALRQARQETQEAQKALLEEQAAKTKLQKQLQDMNKQVVGMTGDFQESNRQREEVRAVQGAVQAAVGAHARRMAEWWTKECGAVSAEMERTAQALGEQERALRGLVGGGLAASRGLEAPCIQPGLTLSP